MPTVSDTLASAFRHHQAGDLQAAEKLYRQILVLAPDHADALHLLGLVDFQSGKNESAAQHIQRAIELKDNESGFHGNLGNVYRAQGNLDRAIECYRRALELNPNYSVALFNLATALQEQGRLEEAAESYRSALKLRPDHAETLKRLGNVLYEMGHSHEAVHCLRHVQQLQPNDQETYGLLGNALRSLGELDEAIRSFRQALEIKPDDAAAYFNLGNVLQAQGQSSAAVDSYRRSLRIDPGHPAAHFNLAIALQAAGQLHEAIDTYRSALELQPIYPEVDNNLGNAYLKVGKVEDAVACFRRAIVHRPDFPEAFNNLGNALQAHGNLDEAADAFRQALALNPDYAVACYNLGNALQTQGHVDEAIEAYRRALAIQPNDAVAWNNLSTALQAQRKYNDAANCCRRALELDPTYAEACNNLGNIDQEQGNSLEALAHFQKAIQLRPDYAEAHNNLGHALQSQGKLNDAAICFQKAIALKPDFPEALCNLGAVLNDQGKVDEGITYFRRSLELKPDYAKCSNNLLLALQYSDGSTLSGLAAAHSEFDRVQAAPLRRNWKLHENDRSPERPLRLGFLSADFGRHPVGFFLIRALENLNRSQYQVVCYNDRSIHDELTVRFQAAVTEWRNVHGMRDAELAETIRADEIDILFDLAGHTAKNRLLVFARKPAPIQISWAGYAGTTGLQAIDYILADRYEIPPVSEIHYCERVLRMPEGYVCYDPPTYAPLVSSLPALAHGVVTFGSFNNPAKITPQVLAVWAKILRRLPQTRLVLKFKGMDDVSTIDRLSNEFGGHGIDPIRVECLGWTPHEVSLAEYSRIDIALDTFPYSGGLTTCEALWMGVPVITCPGETFASRHSFSHLSNIGLTETIARNRDEYIELAVTLAGDLPRLANLRGSLRDRMAASPLCDWQRFANNLMQLLREVWRQWCLTSAGMPTS
jgi:predicted O-linked N-acetylglucosamine transferase (SPINDLY family)